MPRTKQTPTRTATRRLTDKQTAYRQAAILKRIRARREMLKLSQAAAADRAGWAPSTWADIERGRFSPKITTLLKIASVLQCSVAHLCRI